MTSSILVKEYLESEPLFRERKNKDRGIVNLLLKRYVGLKMAIERRDITKDQIVSLVQDYATLDRSWRKTLEENPALRGQDYDSKDILEAKAMSGLGYNVSQPKEVEAAEKDNQPTLL